jgi:hypothetical protein
VIGGRISVRDQAAGRLVASTPWNMKSWGETIKVAVVGADGNVVVDVTIESRVRTTLIDWGQSADDLKRFGDWVTKTQPVPRLPPQMEEEMRMLIDAARLAVADLQAVVPPDPKGTIRKDLTKGN